MGHELSALVAFVHVEIGLALCTVFGPRTKICSPSTPVSLRLFLHHIQAISFSLQSCRRHICTYTHIHIKNMYTHRYMQCWKQCNTDWLSLDQQLNVEHGHLCRKSPFRSLNNRHGIGAFLSVTCWASTQPFVLGGGKPSVFGRSNNCYTLALLLRI